MVVKYENTHTQNMGYRHVMTQVRILASPFTIYAALDKFLLRSRFPF